METWMLYHGSSKIVDCPEFGKGKKYNDYGKGFYCTESIELAKEWACHENIDGYVSKYAINAQDLTILNLSDGMYSTLNWLAILMQNRIGTMNAPVERRGREYLIEHFLPNYDEYDLIVGYRADDSYFSFARAFVANTISLKQLSYAMKLGKLGEQVVLKSEKAFDAIEFLGYEIADNTIYYPKRKRRDEKARAAYRRKLEEDDWNGIYMRDIIKEEMMADDDRLR